ncbi:hypothetical protein MAM1_0101c05266 [Mucor ambiguus]|uniref:Histone-lysine N-methyltransferase SET9 n=1 Tax=Mucor ambiguus TaxID=91626 RepID=A0A0C9M736_9FUNG|nr:hypothetical protein MAM1_0101c05266 [Mucor ambiguus]
MLSNTNNNTKENKDNLMNFKVLSRYDDLFTDIFLDNMFLWFATIKMNNDHRKPRVSNQTILDIIQRNILEKARPMDAVTELLALSYFKHYLMAKNQKQVQEFIQHMKRYLYMYMPNAGYEVGDTRRYGSNGRRVEACLVATKDWQVGDEMRLLTGMIACLDPKDDAELKKGNRDFSVMWSTRKNCSCLFLGPARFANHDCDSNCKFISLGQNSITFKVLKNIKCGQEITVYYGKHYFGENNCECRCITCENLGMGYFASLETKESTPIDMKEEEQGGTRRSTRKRKSALHEEYVDYSHSNSPSPSPNPNTRHSKRASLEPSPKSSNSLEELIGEQQQQKIELDSHITIKKEATPPMPISPTTATTERMARLKVMSIDFLCGSDEEMSPAPSDRRVSDCPLLDLLVDTAMDAGYLESEEQTHHHRQSGQITVVVNPEIHRDAAHRVYMQQQQQHQHHFQYQHPDQEQSKSNLQISRHSKESPTQPDSPQSSSLDSRESKADSAVSLSPRLQLSGIKNEEEDCKHFFRREMDDGLFESHDDFDDFLDDVSDLSSVGSTELESEMEEVQVAPARKAKKSTSPLSAHSHRQQQAPLACIACSRPLKKEDISEQVGADMSITNELATWTWSPSAIFTDWNPKRCPRCERHRTIFKQEWPNRKIKKKKPSSDDENEDDKKSKLSGNNSSSSSSVSLKRKKIKRKPTAHKKSALSSSPVTAAAAAAATTTQAPSTPVYQMQDDPADLNYIPPSPLSEAPDDDDDDDDPF